MDVSPRQAQLLVLAGLVSEHEDGTHRIRPPHTWEEIDANLDSQRSLSRAQLLKGRE